jgi:hypothetical protein
VVSERIARWKESGTECVLAKDYDALRDAAIEACSVMGCYCTEDPPDRSCVMCKLSALVSSTSSDAGEHGK